MLLGGYRGAYTLKLLCQPANQLIQVKKKRDCKHSIRHTALNVQCMVPHENLIYVYWIRYRW